MAWYTGEACGLTATLSAPPRWPNHSAVMIPTIDADEAWWPPTLISPGGRSRLAWSTMRTASHSTRRWISSSVARSGAAGRGRQAAQPGSVSWPGATRRSPR